MACSLWPSKPKEGIDCHLSHLVLLNVSSLCHLNWMSNVFVYSYFIFFIPYFRKCNYLGLVRSQLTLWNLCAITELILENIFLSAVKAEMILGPHPCPIKDYFLNNIFKILVKYFSYTQLYIKIVFSWKHMSWVPNLGANNAYLSERVEWAGKDRRPSWDSLPRALCGRHLCGSSPGETTSSQCLSPGQSKRALKQSLWESCPLNYMAV